MVMLHVKRSDKDHFLLEVPAAALGSDALTLSVRISNVRHRLLSLCEDGMELLRSGPAQQPQEEGADSDEEPESNLAGYESERAVLSKEAEAAGRNERGTAGAKEVQNDSGPAVQAREVLTRALADAKEAAHSDQVTRRVALTEAALQAALDAVRGAVLAAFPSGLPPWDPVRRGLEGAVQGQGREMLDPAAAELWFAGQPLARDAPLSARLGRNDKTRVVLRLQRCGQGAPARETARHVLACMRWISCK